MEATHGWLEAQALLSSQEGLSLRSQVGWRLSPSDSLFAQGWLSQREYGAGVGYRRIW